MDRSGERRRYRQNNLAREKLSNRRWNDANRSRVEDLRMQRDYGLPVGRYQVIRDEQDGLCAICRNPPNEGKKLVVDHDHETGYVRGLLCGSCNKAIGLLGDNVETLESAIDYLECAGIDYRMEQMMGGSPHSRRGGS